MIQKEITVLAEAGLHARPAAQFVKLCNTFKSDIKLSYKGKTFNGKSMMEMMTAGIPKGGVFSLTIDGSDEVEALEALEKMLSEAS